MQTIDYQSVIDVMGDSIRLALPLGIAFGLCERLVQLVLDAALDRFRRRERM